MTRRILVALSLASAAGFAAGCRNDSDDYDADTPLEDRGAGDADADAPLEDLGAGDADADAPLDELGAGDADADADAPECSTLAELRAMPDGTTDVLVCNLTVTYAFGSAYFVQEGVAGPAIEVWEGPGWAMDTAVGDRVSLRVTSLSSFHGTRNVDGHAPVVVHASGYPVEPLVQDLTSGIPPGEDLESELVRVRGAVVETLDGRDATIRYGTATGVAVRFEDVPSLCVGAAFDILAVVTDWDGTHQIQTWRLADLTNVDTTPCPGPGTPPEPGELLLNEFLADPPRDLAGDANCDGVRDDRSQQDEFVELVNVSDHIIGLRDVSISDETGVRHVFGAGASLDPGGVFVVFGGGTPSCAFPPFAQVDTAADGALGLNNDGDTITIGYGSGAAAVTIVAHTFGAEGGDDQSLTLSPDLDDEDPLPAAVGGFVPHTAADTIDGSAFSPGARIDGSAF